MILYAEHARGIGGALTIGAVIVLMCGVLLVALRAAGRLASLLGPTGMNVPARLMGMILAAIAVEMMAASGSCSRSCTSPAAERHRKRVLGATP